MLLISVLLEQCGVCTGRRLWGGGFGVLPAAARAVRGRQAVAVVALLLLHRTTPESSQVGL
eukprot:COSAG02_NODE_1026_length_15134_cov_382.979714_6_plen_61_part_00